MELKEIVTHLRQIPLFQNLRPDRDVRDERLLYLVAEKVQEAEYAPGDSLFEQGEPADRLYYVLRGRIQLTAFGPDGSRLDLGFKQPGDSFGVAGLFVGDFHDASAEAYTPVRILYLTHDDFLPLLEHHPRLRRLLSVPPDLQRQRHLPHFPWMRPEEVAILVGQRHGIELARRALLPALGLVAVVALAFVLAPMRLQALESPDEIWNPLPWLIFPAVVFGLWLGWDWLDWHDDRFILTTQRVMHIERKGPFGSMSEEASLDDIQDVLEVKPNVLANFFDYGDIILHTAGGTVKIDFTEVYRPAVWREAILREMGRIQARRVVRLRGETRVLLENRLHLVPPQEPPAKVAPQIESPSSLKFFVSTVRELLFPASWVESPDGQTIKWRRYWLPGFIRYWWVSMLFLLATGGGLWWAARQVDENPLLVGGWLVLEMILLGVVMWYIEDWRNDFFEITPSHIIHVDRRPLWGRLIRQEARLDRIQNITSDVPGLWARMFKFGTVTLETAGATGKFEMEFVRDPERVRAEIARRQQEFRRRDLARQAAQRQDELLSWFAIYDSLRHGASTPDSPDKTAPGATDAV